MKIYAFDVDDTLEISNGPIPIKKLRQLRENGHIVGICGNWQKFITAVPDWRDIINFFQVGLPKTNFLIELKAQLSYIFQIDEFVMIGNLSSDIDVAQAANWTFVKESDFVKQ